MLLEVLEKKEKVLFGEETGDEKYASEDVTELVV